MVNVQTLAAVTLLTHNSLLYLHFFFSTICVLFAAICFNNPRIVLNFLPIYSLKSLKFHQNSQFPDATTLSSTFLRDFPIYKWEFSSNFPWSQKLFRETLFWKLNAMTGGRREKLDLKFFRPLAWRLSWQTEPIAEEAKSRIFFLLSVRRVLLPFKN